MSMATVDEYWTNEKESAATSIVIEYATVIQLTHQLQPIIQFIGERRPSMKTYPAMKHYNPAIGDRVMLINGIITGGWRP